METYSLHYDIESANLYLSENYAKSFSNFSEIRQLLHHINSSNDLISIYAKKKMVRIQIWGDDMSEWLTMEISKSEVGLNFSKNFLIGEILNITTVELENFIKSPLENNFSAESF